MAVILIGISQLWLIGLVVMLKWRVERLERDMDYLISSTEYLWEEP